MFQTEFCESNYNLVISWDTANSTKSRVSAIKNNVSCNQFIFHKLNELYQNISKSASEYVEYLENIYESMNLDQLQSRLRVSNPNITCWIKSRQNEHPSEEVSSLRQRIKQLIQEKEQLIAEHENQIFKEQNDFDQRIRDIINLNHARLNSVKEEIENKYKLEMTNLRTTFENKFTATQSVAEQNIHGNRTNFSTRSESYLKTEPNDEYYKATTSTKRAESNLDCFSNDKNFNTSVNMIHSRDLKYVPKSESNSTCELDEGMSKQNRECRDHVELSLNRMDIEDHNSPDEKLPKSPKLVTEDHLSSEEKIDRLLSELPTLQADLDSFVYPFPIEDELFKDNFWTCERRKDMSVVNELTKNFMNYKSMKKKLFSHVGAFSKYKEYCHGNVFPCWEIRCLIRNKRFPTPIHRDAHIKKYHPDGRTIFICSNCHWPESSQESLTKHETTSRCRKRKR